MILTLFELNFIHVISISINVPFLWAITKPVRRLKTIPAILDGFSLLFVLIALDGISFPSNGVRGTFWSCIVGLALEFGKFSIDRDDMQSLVSPTESRL